MKVKYCRMKHSTIKKVKQGKQNLFFTFTYCYFYGIELVKSKQT